MLRERYLEAHDLVMRAWQQKDTFAFNGRYNQQRYVNIWPRPVQRPHPPVWIPGGGCGRCTGRGQMFTKRCWL